LGSYVPHFGVAIFSGFSAAGKARGAGPATQDCSSFERSFSTVGMGWGRVEKKLRRIPLT
jgi:hypothetical protein